MITETLTILETYAQSWMRHALCADADPELFFPNPELTAEIRQARTEQAQRICARCPVRAHCLRWAYKMNDEWAILGGKTKNQRKRIKNRIARKRELDG